VRSSLGLAQRHVRSQANHERAGQRPLTPAETLRSTNALAERPGEQRYDDVRGGIERDRRHSQHYKLQKYVAARPVHELWDEGEKEQRRLGIQGLGHHPLTERTSPDGKLGDGNVGVFPCVENHADAEETEIACAQILHRGKGDGGPGENDRDTGSSGEHVHHAAQKCAEGGEQAFAASSGESAGEHVEHAGTGRDGEQDGSAEEDEEPGGMDHDPRIVSSIRRVVPDQK